MRASVDEVLSRNQIMVIDGSMSTALENMGADLNNDLWTAMTLVRQPELVRQVHMNYFRAGADCGITCSYQATIPGLIKHGFTQQEAEDMLARAVRLFQDARTQWWQDEGEAQGRAYPICLAGIGPYGAYLADGSEYTGKYEISDEDLDVFHRRRMEVLHEAGADILLIETQPSLREVLIEAVIAEELQADYWISFSCRDGKHINEGNLIRECAQALSEGYPHLKMIGVNCTKPEYITELIRELKTATSLPIAVYPNSGEIYDPTTKTWTSASEKMNFGDYALSYMKAGAAAVGGCCTTVEAHVRQVVEARERFCSMGSPSEIHLRNKR